MTSLLHSLLQITLAFVCAHSSLVLFQNFAKSTEGIFRCCERRIAGDKTEYTMAAHDQEVSVNSRGTRTDCFSLYHKH
ncbi:hypothetical protein Y032_0199g1646 [Ancylostoma ceylanicum]|uniref:Secreted protein n=1 Tax=Ancylostoma ceylanicum TaxID=53326 RepID=A0A016SMQ2_9BILA|nr:hypothetical protein Y032_0199g1646 [Ancylostoma ceylanicum]